MFELQMWQWIPCLAAAVASLGGMSLALWWTFSRRAESRATVRKATRVESALVGGEVPQGAHVFDGWAYRLTPRFAGRVRIAVYADRAAVSGPRVPRLLYEAWMWAQSLLLALVAPLLLAAALDLSWRWLVVAIVTFIVSFVISMGGAGLWPGLGEILVDKGLFNALEFPLSSVRDVTIGKGWSKGGFGILLFPYKRGIDTLAENCVSFFAPDEHGREVRFAIDTYTPENAQALADLLG